jgi:hypothetical protein
MSGGKDVIRVQEKVADVGARKIDVRAKVLQNPIAIHIVAPYAFLLAFDLPKK